MAEFSARIHVLLAANAPVGLVIRRGPSRQVATILWNRNSDTFEIGQWLKGRIYERRSDISPDGKYFIYFAMNGKWNTESRGAWTAVSRLPYLKALVMMPKGDSWHGGGLWTDDRRYWVDDGYGHSLLKDCREVTRDRSFDPTEEYGKDRLGVYYPRLGVYYPRLLRDGWEVVESAGTKWQGNAVDLFEKPIGNDWTIRRIAHADSQAPDGKSCYWDEHQLVNRKIDAEIDCPEWEWADADGSRLVWATGGKLFASVPTSNELGAPEELRDFNDMKFEPVQAPY